MRNEFMRYGWVVATGVLFVVVIGCISALWRYTELANHTIVTTHEEMLAMATTLDRGAANEAVAAIVRDCPRPEREQFDTLLGELEALNQAELATITTLFGGCADYFADTRAVMSLVLETKYETLVTAVALQPEWLRSDETETLVEAWEELITLERERAQLSLDLVRVQGNIIARLREGVQADAEPMRLLLTEANEIRESMSFIGIQIDQLRTETLTL